MKKIFPLSLHTFRVLQHIGKCFQFFKPEEFFLPHGAAKVEKQKSPPDKIRKAAQMRKLAVGGGFEPPRGS
jgi:hypothetical protein